MVFNQTEKQERSYLQQIITRLKQIISHTDMSVKNHADTLAEYKDYLWNNKDIDPHEIRSMRESILNHFAIGESVIDKTPTACPNSGYSLLRPDRLSREEREPSGNPCLYRYPYLSRY